MTTTGKKEQTLCVDFPIMLPGNATGAVIRLMDVTKTLCDNVSNLISENLLNTFQVTRGDGDKKLPKVCTLFECSDSTEYRNFLMDHGDEYYKEMYRTLIGVDMPDDGAKNVQIRNRLYENVGSFYCNAIEAIKKNKPPQVG